MKKIVKIKKELSLVDVMESISFLSTAMDESFDKMEERMESGFNRIHAELALIRGELDDIKVRLDKIEKRTCEDADAQAGDILKLQHQVFLLDKRVQIMEKNNKF